MRLILFLVCISLSLSVHATRFYSLDGKTWIREGISLNKLYQLAGYPLNDRVAWECPPKRKRCKDEDEILVRTLFYKDNNDEKMRWIIKAYTKSDRIFSIEWTRN